VGREWRRGVKGRLFLDDAFYESPANAYSSALPLLTIAETEIATLLPPDSGPPNASGSRNLDFSSFTRFHELWRWGRERLIWRAVILVAQTRT
jgi:hypothetical protein